MNFRLFKVSGYEEAILSLRMSKGNFYTWEKARNIQELVWLVTDQQGFVCSEEEYGIKLGTTSTFNNKLTDNYEKDVNEFKRLLQLTFNNSMGENGDHHTLMKYIDISFITDGLHRGGQDDLDAHAMRFGNRITRFSTRLAEISEQKVSEWYKDKVIPFHDAIEQINKGLLESFQEPIELPKEIHIDENVFKLTPFGYVLDKYAQVPAKNGLAKDVQRGLMGLATPGPALWKIDLHELRYVYFRRSKLTKANPELKEGMEQLADQIEKSIPVFGPYFRKQLTDSGQWEHVNKVKTISDEEYNLFKKLKRGAK